MNGIGGDLSELTIDRLHQAVRANELTSVAVVEHYLSRISKYDQVDDGLQAVVTVNPEALAEATAADDHFAATGTLLGPLHGVPVLVKDQAETAGLRTSFGSRLFADYTPSDDATVIRRLREAGAVVLAKTAICDFAAGWFSFSSLTGHTKNPYARERDSGGSSAGTGAGIAANLGLVGIGEDTGGSIRIPASFNNLFGLRVTTGLISRSGFSPLVHFQDTPGPIARTVADLARLLDCLVGYDPADPYTAVNAADPRQEGYADALAAGSAQDSWRIGVLETGFGWPGNPDADPVTSVVRSAVDLLGSVGATVRPGVEIDDLPGWISSTSMYLRQSKSDINQFLADRPAAPVSRFEDIVAAGTFHPLNDLIPGIVMGPDSVDDDFEILRARARQEDFRRLLLDLFARHEVDFIVYPTVQVIPPTRAELEDLKYQCLTFPTNTVIASQAGLPALTMPVGFTADGLPVGMEVLGTPFAESKMLRFAQAWENAVQPRRTPEL